MSVFRKEVLDVAVNHVGERYRLVYLSLATLRKGKYWFLYCIDLILIVFIELSL